MPQDLPPSLLSSLTSLLSSNTQAQTPPPTTTASTQQQLNPQLLQQLLNVVTVTSEGFPETLRVQIQNATVPQTIQATLIDLPETPLPVNQIPQASSQTPVTQGERPVFFEVTFQQNGQNFRLNIPQALAQTLQVNNNYQLTFQPRIPLSLSGLTLIQTPPQQSAQTPINVQSLLQTNNLTPLQNNGFVQALTLPNANVTPSTTNTQAPQINVTAATNNAVSPSNPIINNSQNLQTGQTLIVQILQTPTQSPATPQAGQSNITQSTNISPSPLRALIQNLNPFSTSTPTAPQQSTVQTPIQSVTNTSTQNNQTTNITGAVPKGTRTPPPSTPQVIQIGNQTLNLNAPLNQQAPIQTGTVVGSFEGAPIVSLKANKLVQGAQTTPNSTTNTTQQPQLLLLTNTKLPLNSEVSLRVLHTQTQIETPLPLEEINLQSTQNQQQLPPQRWQGLEALLQNIEQLVPDALPQLQAQIPTPATQNNQQLTTSLLFFLKALQLRAPVSDWVGNNASQLVDQNISLEALENDFEQLTRPVIESSSGQEFQRFTLPLQTEEKLQPFYLFLRHSFQEQQQQDHKSKKDDLKIGDGSKKEMRFLVNLELSHIGDVQLDGLYKNKNITTILRLGKPLPQEIQNTMTARYTSVLESLGMTGGLRFQDTKDWVKFEDKTQNPTRVQI